jgi:TRAP-type C4-dicarboxylate transport system permease small subunit
MPVVWRGKGLLTRKMSEKKRNWLVIILDIAVILAFIWFAMTQTLAFTQGYDTCMNTLCTKFPAWVCSNLTVTP